MAIGAAKPWPPRLPPPAPACCGRVPPMPRGLSAARDPSAHVAAIAAARASPTWRWCLGCTPIAARRRQCWQEDRLRARAGGSRVMHAVVACASACTSAATPTRPPDRAQARQSTGAGGGGVRLLNCRAHLPTARGRSTAPVGVHRSPRAPPDSTPSPAGAAAHAPAANSCAPAVGTLEEAAPSPASTPTASTPSSCTRAWWGRARSCARCRSSWWACSARQGASSAWWRRW